MATKSTPGIEVTQTLYSVQDIRKILNDELEKSYGSVRYAHIRDVIDTRNVPIVQRISNVRLLDAQGLDTIRKAIVDIREKRMAVAG